MTDAAATTDGGESLSGGEITADEEEESVTAAAGHIVISTAASGTNGYRSPRWYFYLQVGGKRILALVDPGSDVSVIDQQEAETRKLDIEPLPKAARLRMLGGEAEMVATRYVPALRMVKGDWSDVRRVLVVPGSAAPLILGMDWLDRLAPLRSPRP